MTSKRHRVRVCEAKGCNNTSKNSNKSLYLFPTDPERRSQWIENLEVSSTSTRKVKFACSDHFGIESFVDTLKRRIHRTAVPEPLSKKCKLEDKISKFAGETVLFKTECLSLEIDPDIDDPDVSTSQGSCSDNRLRMVAATKSNDEPRNCVTIKTEPDTDYPDLEKSSLCDDSLTMVAARNPIEVQYLSIKTELDTDDPYLEKSSAYENSLTAFVCNMSNKNELSLLKNVPGPGNSDVDYSGDATSKMSTSANKCFRIVAPKKPNETKSNFLKNDRAFKNSDVNEPVDATSKNLKTYKTSTIPCYRVFVPNMSNKKELSLLKNDPEPENSDVDDPVGSTSKISRVDENCFQKPRHRTRFCDAKGCTNSSKNSDKSLFLFPTDPERNAIWMRNLEASSSRKVKFACSDHFDMDSFVDSFRRRLHRVAVPVPLSQIPNLEVKVPRTPEETQPSENKCIFFEIDPEIDNLDDSSLEKSSSDDESSRSHSSSKTNNPASKKCSSQNDDSIENKPPHKKMCINDKCLVHHSVT